ncbi:MAG: tetratricopeptide repeat protein [Mariprofundaceae bacterium]|nr:tetratricopeptide repeat protein [Mariprofundaceae bacterium]
MDNKTPPIEISKDEMQELQRDMRSARIHAWVNKYQQQLFVGLIMLIIIIVGVGMYKERLVKQQEGAATLFHQAMDTADTEKRQDFFNEVVTSYSGSSYAAMSLMILSSIDSSKSKEHLTQLLAHSKCTLEMTWQAHLDLAGIYINENNIEKAKSELAYQVGEDYAELRYFLLAQIEQGADAKRDLLEKAQEAISHDKALQKHIEQLLLKLKSAA